MIPAVVCGTNTRTADASSVSSSASRTCSVMSTASVLRSVLTSSSCSTRSIPSYPTAPMATAPVGSSTLDAYREEADRFLAALDEEIYLHFAGLKDEFEVARIYERFSDLTTLDACSRLHGAVETDGAAAVELWRFACEGYLGDITRDLTEEIAQLEATPDVDVKGETIPFRM